MSRIGIRRRIGVAILVLLTGACASAARPERETRTTRQVLIEGVVWQNARDSTAWPQSDVQVTLFRAGERQPLATAVTDRYGRYRLETRLADGEHHLRYAMIGRIPEVRRLVLAAEDSVELEPVCMYVASIADVWIVGTVEKPGGHARQFRDTVDAVVVRGSRRPQTCTGAHLTRWITTPGKV